LRVTFECYVLLNVNAHSNCKWTDNTSMQRIEQFNRCHSELVEPFTVSSVEIGIRGSAMGRNRLIINNLIKGAVGF